MDKVLLFAEDLSEDAGRPSFDDAAFQTYQRIGQSMIEGFIDNSIVQGLATSLSNAFASLNESWRLTTGLSMEIIWELLRPPSVEHASLLELRFGTEQLADRFDALSWTTGASIEKLTALRGSIVQVFGMLDFADADSEKRLQVCWTFLKQCTILTPLGRPNCFRPPRKDTKSGYANENRAFFPTLI